MLNCINPKPEFVYISQSFPFFEKKCILAVTFCPLKTFYLLEEMHNLKFYRNADKNLEKPHASMLSLDFCTFL